MEKQCYTEQDWKLFKSRIPGWQEAYMNKLTLEYAALLTGDGKASEKFWALEKRIRKDRRSPGVCIDMRRSMLVQNLTGLLSDGVISLEDLNGFSDELKSVLTALCRLWK